MLVKYVVKKIKIRRYFVRILLYRLRCYFKYARRVFNLKHCQDRFESQLSMHAYSGAITSSTILRLKQLRLKLSRAKLCTSNETKLKSITIYSTMSKCLNIPKQPNKSASYKKKRNEIWRMKEKLKTTRLRNYKAGSFNENNHTKLNVVKTCYSCGMRCTSLQTRCSRSLGQRVYQDPSCWRSKKPCLVTGRTGSGSVGPRPPESRSRMT